MKTIGMRRIGRFARWMVWFVSLIALAACVAPALPASSLLSDGVPASSATAGVVLLSSCTRRGDCELIPIDVATAQPAAGLAPIPIGRYALHALSPDGRRLATVTYPSNMSMTDGRLLVTDLEAWRTVTSTVESTLDNVFQQPVFSADGNRVALVVTASGYPPGEKIALFDLARQTEVRSERLPIHPRRIAFSADGTALHLYGGDDGDGQMQVNRAAHALRLDAETLAIEWQQQIDGLRDGQFIDAAEGDPATIDDIVHAGIWWEAAASFSGDGETLYILHADEQRLTTVRFGRGEVATAAVAPRQGWVEWLLARTARPAYAKILNGTSRQSVLSPDGRTLYAAGTERSYLDEIYREQPLALEVIDVASGALTGTGPAATSVQLSHDGALLLLNSWVYDSQMSSATIVTEIVEAATLKPLARFEEWTLYPLRTLSGEPVLVGQRYDAETEETELAFFEAGSWAQRLVTLGEPVKDEGVRSSHWLTPWLW